MATTTVPQHEQPHAHADHGHHKPSHPYHLVDPSPWPLVGSLSALLLTSGGDMWLDGHAAARWVTLLGVAGGIGGMGGWRRDVLGDSRTGAQSDVGCKGLGL